MDNNDVKELIESFKAYRELLSPIQANLNEFVGTYDSLRADIDRLNAAFGDDVKGNLERIYKSLASQADKATDLSSRIDRFVTSADRYTTQVDKLTAVFATVEEKLTSINEIEARAEEQIGKLDAILEDKKKSYNVKELQRTLESYNSNVQKISEFINRDVAEALGQNQSTLDSIKTKNETLLKRIEDESTSVEALATSFATSSSFLKEIADKETVNETYLFEILDKWAAERKVKTKK